MINVVDSSRGASSLAEQPTSPTQFTVRLPSRPVAAST
jgi:hypothetical protein